MMLRQQLPVYSPLSGTAIRRAVVSGLGPGPDGQVDFRSSLERDYAAEQAMLFASGTQALQVALRVAMHQVGDLRVALPAFTCFDVASAAVGACARISCYDVDPTTLGPDFDSLRRAFERGIRVAVISPLYGFPVDWNVVADLAARFGALAIEDAAQGHHARWRGRRLGSLGPLSVLSFGRGKGWTGGSGGALLVRDQASGGGLRDTLRGGSDPSPRRGAEARLVAALAAQWVLARPRWYALPYALPWLRLGETYYRQPSAPQPMPRAASACLATLREAADREGATRRATAETILAAISTRPDVQAVAPLRDATPGYLRLPLRLARGIAGFADATAAMRLGLASSYPAVLPAIPQIRPWLDDCPADWPGADELVRTLVTLPTHSRLTERERARLIQLLHAYPDES
jgi:dTDP-4-amino-4,6-dideoxygalactose transaminase